MKKLLLIILSLPFLFAFQNAYAKDVLKVSFFNAPPHIMIDKESGEVTGALAEFFNKNIAPEMGVEVRWDKSTVAIARLTDNLVNGISDMAILLAINPERAKIFEFPQNSFLKTGSVLVFKKDHSLNKVTKVEDILSLKIGSGDNMFVTPFMRDKRIKFDTVPSADFITINLKKVLAGRIDCAYNAEGPAILYILKQLKAEDEVKIILLPDKPASFYSAFSKKVSADIVKRYDIAFKKINGEKVYLNILSKYIDINKLR